jgi:Ulp1 protease family, C-terminal catalytic domain
MKRKNTYSHKPYNKNHTVRKSHDKKMKKMNCNPVTKHKNTVQDSCFPPETLVLIKSSYNKFHPHNKIESTNNAEIWEDLKKRLTTCEKEDCWLNQISDPILRKKLDVQSFAPDQPKVWKKNPNEWLSNYDIMDVLKQYETAYPKFHVIGPTPIDFDSRPKDLNHKCVWEELCNFRLEKYFMEGKKKLGIVFNLDDHNGSGSHWVSMFIDLEDKFAFYMDSAGSAIPKEIDALLKRIVQQGLAFKPPIHIHFYENCPLEHQYGNTECGMYTLYFIITMLTGETEGRKFKNYYEKIRFFKNKRIPDKYIQRYRKIYFNTI